MGRIERERDIKMLHGGVKIAAFAVIQPKLAVDCGVVRTELSGAQQALDRLGPGVIDDVAMRYKCF